MRITLTLAWRILAGVILAPFLVFSVVKDLYYQIKKAKYWVITSRGMFFLE